LQAGDILLIIVAIYLVLAILVRWLFKCLRYLSYRRQYQVQLARTSVAATPGRRDPDGGDIAPAYSDAAPIEWNTSYLAPLPPPLFRQSAYQRQDASPWKPVDTVYGGGGAWAPNDQAQSAFSPTFRPLPPPPQPLHAPANGDPPPAAPFGAGGAIVRRTVRFADGVGSGDAWDAALDAPRKSRHQFDGGASRKSLRCTVYEMSSEGAVERPNVLSNLTHALTHARVYGTMIPVHSVALALVFVLVIVLIVFLFPADTWTWADSMGHVAGAVGLLTALPATRNSLLCWLLDMHFDATIMYHRWLGRLAVFLAFVHLVAYFATGVDGWSPPDASHILTEKYLFGFLAFAAGLWIVVTAFDTVRRLQFEFFYWSHFAFLLWYVFSALHSPVCAIYAYVAAGIYALDRLVRFFWGLWPRRAILHREGGRRGVCALAQAPAGALRRRQLRLPQLSRLLAAPVAPVHAGVGPARPVQRGGDQESRRLHHQAARRRQGAGRQRAALGALRRPVRSLHDRLSPLPDGGGGRRRRRRHAVHRHAARHFPRRHDARGPHGEGAPHDQPQRLLHLELRQRRHVPLVQGRHRALREEVVAQRLRSSCICTFTRRARRRRPRQ
jgi:hypothetical protein